MNKPRLNKIFNTLEDCPTEYRGGLPGRFINIKGDKYNYLEVLYLVGFRNARSEWLCRCNNCGRYVVVNSHNLRTGHTKSCGCLISEKLRKDLTGQTFGYLEVLSYDKSINENPYWKVRCNNCNKEYSVSGDALKRQTSCGCILSPGEKKISELLLQYGVIFTPQKTFEGLVGKNNNKLRFDFAIYMDGKLSHLVEMQGIQHYYNVFGVPEEEYKYRLSLDEVKRQWCKENKIPLVEIKYDEEITIEKILCYHTKGVIIEDFVQYSKPTMFITNTVCDLKCEKECGIQCCANNQIFKEPTIALTFDKIIYQYLKNPITKSITFGGLEQFDEPEQLELLIKIIRQYSNDDIVIYTGYTEEELANNRYYKNILECGNIIIKYGRFRPNQTPHYDEILGVNLASDNQYAKRYN